MNSPLSLVPAARPAALSPRIWQMTSRRDVPARGPAGGTDAAPPANHALLRRCWRRGRRTVPVWPTPPTLPFSVLVDDMMRIGRRTSQEVHLPIYEQN